MFRDVFVLELEIKFTTVISSVQYLFLLATSGYQCFLLDRKHLSFVYNVRGLVNNGIMLYPIESS